MIIGESPVKDIYRVLVWGAAPSLSMRLPPPTESRLVRALGRLSARVLIKKRKQIEKNIQLAFPRRSDRFDIASGAFAAHFANQYVAFSIPKIQPDISHRYIRWEGLDKLQDALKEGGAVLAHPHMGPAQLPLHDLGLRFGDVHQIGGGEVHLVQKSNIGNWASEKRDRLEQKIAATLHDGKGYLRPALRALEGGGIVLSACDATGGGKELGRRLPATLLGQSFPLPIGHAWFAWKARVPLFPLYCIRDPKRRSLYLARIGEPVRLNQKTKASAIEAGVRWAEKFLNTTLNEHPESWLFWDGFCTGGLIR